MYITIQYHTLPTAGDWRLSEATSSLSNTALDTYSYTHKQLQLVYITIGQ